MFFPVPRLSELDLFKILRKSNNMGEFHCVENYVCKKLKITFKRRKKLITLNIYRAVSHNCVVGVGIVCLVYK